jgi:hypothetical protein
MIVKRSFFRQKPEEKKTFREISEGPGEKKSQ